MPLGLQAPLHRGGRLARPLDLRLRRSRRTESARTILEGVGLYGETPDGIVPWKARPPEFRKGVVARIPPLTTPDAAE